MRTPTHVWTVSLAAFGLLACACRADAAPPPRDDFTPAPRDRPAVISIMDMMHNVRQVAFSPDGRTLAACAESWATADKEELVKLYDVATLEERLRFRPVEDRVRTGDNSAHAPMFSPDGRLLALADSYGEVALWDPSTGRRLSVLPGSDRGVRALSFSPDGTTLAVCPAGRDPWVLDPSTGRERMVLRGHDVKQGRRVRAVAYSPDGKRIATACEDRTARVWDAATGRQIRAFTDPNGFFSVAFSPDGRSLAAGTDCGDPDRPCPDVLLWDVETGQQKAACVPGHEKQVCALAFRPDGRTLVSLTRCGAVHLWDVETGQEKAAFQRHLLYPDCMALSPDGKTIALGGIFQDPVTGVITILETDGETFRLREPAP